MKWRIDATIFTDDEKLAKTIFQTIKNNKIALVSIRKGQPDAVQSVIKLEKCYHDEGSGRPCELIDEVVV